MYCRSCSVETWANLGSSKGSAVGMRLERVLTLSKRAPQRLEVLAGHRKFDRFGAQAYARAPCDGARCLRGAFCFPTQSLLRDSSSRSCRLQWPRAGRPSAEGRRTVAANKTPPLRLLAAGTLHTPPGPPQSVTCPHPWALQPATRAGGSLEPGADGELHGSPGVAGHHEQSIQPAAARTVARLANQIFTEWDEG